MKKMFLVLSLLVVAPVFAEDSTATATTEDKGFFAKTIESISNAVNSVVGVVSNGYNYASDKVETAGSYIPGSQFVSDNVIPTIKNNVKVAMVVVAAATYAVVKTSNSSSDEAELE